MTKKEFVSMSLPYGLKVLIPESDNKYCRKTVVGTVGAVFDDGSINCFDTVNSCPRWYKPILIPLKYAALLDSDENISLIDNKTKDYIKKGNISLVLLSAFNLKALLMIHFDVAGLIEKGQAIDVNSLEFNPYSGRVNQYINK